MRVQTAMSAKAKKKSETDDAKCDDETGENNSSAVDTLDQQ